MSLDQLYEEVSRQLEINLDNIGEELSRQPSRYAYWGAMAAHASKKLARQKLNLAEVKAKLARDYRIAMADNEPNVRVTESMVDAFVTVTDEFKDQIQKVIYAQHEDDLLSVAKEALRQRAQMLLELGRQRREEMYEEGGLTIYKEDRGKNTTAARNFRGLLSGKKEYDRARTPAGEDS